MARMTPTPATELTFTVNVSGADPATVAEVATAVRSVILTIGLDTTDSRQCNIAATEPRPVGWL